MRLIIFLLFLTGCTRVNVGQQYVFKRPGATVVFGDNLSPYQPSETLYQVVRGDSVRGGKYLYLNLRNDLKCTPKLARRLDAVHGVTDVMQLDRYRLVVWYAPLFTFNEVSRNVEGVVRLTYMNR